MHRSIFKPGTLPFALLTALLVGVAVVSSAVLGSSSAVTPRVEDPHAAVPAPKATTQESAVLPASESAGGAGAPQIEIGDRLRISFFEALDVQEDKWGADRGGRARGPSKSFYQRAELTGEYVVQDDGMISIPMLGAFRASGQAAPALQATLAQALEKLVGRKGFVNILTVEQQPIYIVGPVKATGALKYSTGMTVLHAVALAGGLDRGAKEAWQQVEVTREMERLQRLLERAKRLIARATVLKAERGNAVPPTPAELVELVGKREAASLVGEEGSFRHLTLMAQKSREDTLTTAVQTAKAELEARLGSLAPLEETIRLRSERVNSIAELKSRQVTSGTVLVQAQAELADVQARKQDALMNIAAARQKLAQAEQEKGKFDIENRTQLEHEVAVTERDGTEVIGDSEGLINVLRSLAERQILAANDALATYEILRRTGKETQAFSALETTRLEPGDLIRIRLPTRTMESNRKESAAR
jgi:exopolysaccharide production protein ExoF